MDLALLEETLAVAKEPSYRVGQVWAWAARGVDSYEQMTDLPAALRAALTERVPFSTIALERESVAQDGTRKALLRTHDRRPIEAVLMCFRDGRRSLCVSSQSGCPLTCNFCATGRMRFFRNLTSSEILDQALHFRRNGKPLTHCVFMGMGEPMMNLDHVLDACDRLPDVGITNRRTTISTVGWIPGIERLTESGMPIRLALSLHAPEDTLRTELMPVNERYPLDDIVEACRRHHSFTNRRVFIEYIMLAGINDSPGQARTLAKLLAGGVFKVNLIPYNPTDSPYDGSGREAIGLFRETLERNGVPATVRLTRGRDIDAACGQLAAAG